MANPDNSGESPSGLPQDRSAAVALPARFQVREAIGQGSFGKTWLAFDSDTNQPCVLKQLSFETVDAWKSVELFEREARVLAQLDHPFIPRFLGFYSQAETGAATLAQSFVPGRSLKDLLEAGKRFSEAEAIALARDVLDILVYLQDFAPPVLHRDIKPSNLILDEAGRAHLVDFGAVSENLAHRESGGSTVVGTFGYMPPEQLDGRAVPGTDLYGLGATLIHVLSGIEPQLMEKENLSLNFRPYVEISQGLAAWLAKMTHPDWKQRFLNAREALTALEHRENLLRPDRNQAQPWLLISLSCLAMILVCGWGFWLLRPMAGPQLEGSLSYAGSEPANLPAAAPRFWVRDESTGKRVRPEVSYEAGKFSLRGLPPGSYGLNVTYDYNASNPLQYPGDLRAWQTFQVESGMQPLKLDLPLRRLIHLREPVDNQSPVSGWGRHCSGGADLSGSQTFAWDALEPGLTYQYQVLAGSCGKPEADPGQMPVALSGRTLSESVRLSLPKSKPGSYYRFRLEAYKGSHKIGGLILHSDSDHDWDYRFRIQ